MRPTIRQVAEQAQVSRMTVSRVLQGRRHQVNEDTYQRVMTVMREMNYVPVAVTMQNRRVRTNTIGVVPYHKRPTSNPFENRTLGGLSIAAADSGLDILLMLRGEADWMEDRGELRFLDKRSDGFVFISPLLDQWNATLAALVQHAIPTVVCYRREVPEGIAWVDPDNAGVMQLAIERLAAAGHRRIAYLAQPFMDPKGPDLIVRAKENRTSFDDAERQRHFTGIMRRVGFGEYSECIVRVGQPTWEVLPSDLEALRATGCTAVICVNSMVGVRLWRVAEAAGLRVPRDLSLIGVDDEHLAQEFGLTNVIAGYENIGQLAVQAWTELRDGRDYKECCRVAPVELVERKSVAPPR